MTEEVTFGSTFTGIGGFDLGFEEAGMTCKWQVERDPNCLDLLEYQFPGIEKHEDVRYVGSANLEPVDVICGGFPCQDLSVAGRREGLDGNRSGLWFQYRRIIFETLPKLVVIENVPGLLSSFKGEDFAVLIEGITGTRPRVPDGGWRNSGFAKGAVYNVAWRVLDAQYFGVAQRRRRVFIVASLGTGSCAEILFEPESLYWDTPPSRQAREESPEISGTLAAIGGGLERPAGNGNELDFCVPLVSPTLSKDGYSPSHGPTGQQLDFCIPTTSGTVTTVWAKQKGGPAGDECYNLVPDTSYTLRAGASHSGDKGDGGINTTMVPIANAITTREGNHHDPSIETFVPVEEGIRGVRRLTPTECERLQGFPDGWTERVYGLPSKKYLRECARKGRVPVSRVLQEVSDGVRYHQLGNAVCVNVAAWLGERLRHQIITRYRGENCNG